MNIMQNKIEAKHKSINELLARQRFYIDYFQREYRWGEKHIGLLIEDLTTTFQKSYQPEHQREEVEHYQNYYLGPVVFSDNQNGQRSIIDGQQRITSLTLLLIYLRHLQEKHPTDNTVPVVDLIYSQRLGKKRFNMIDEVREPCLRSLFETGSYDIKEEDDETVKNMTDRYEDIAKFFPEELMDKALPYFVDWLIGNVVLVEITAYSDENAYVIFETMNDRGLNLTSSEMLKGYVLSKISDPKKRIEINNVWKEQIQKLHEYEETADQNFFQSWFRGRYAESIRPGKVGSENQDFELIGTRFHNWFKDNHVTIFKLTESEDFYKYFKYEFPFYVKWFSRIRDAQAEYCEDIPHLHYIRYWGIADSLQYPLLLSPIEFNEDDEVIHKKLDYVARYIETFTVRRSVNYKNFGQTSIKYTMFNIVKGIRNVGLAELADALSKEINNIEQQWDEVVDFQLHGRNKKFVKHFLARISGYADELAGKSSNYVSYHHPTSGKPFEIEHILSGQFDDYKSEFDDKNDFQSWRNSIGALVLLPNGTNQSFGSDKYEDKLKHYLRENTYAQTLHKDFYEKNPNFLNPQEFKKLGFKHHSQFKKKNIEERSDLVGRICKELWSTDYFG